MTIIHVKDTGTNNSTTITPANTAGNTLIMGISGVNNSPTDVANISSITDAAGNVWTFTANALNTLPPASGAVDTTFNAYYFSAVAACLNKNNNGSVQVAGAVTVLFNHNFTHSTRLYVAEFSGLPANSDFNVAVTDNSFHSNPAGNYPMPPLTPTAGQGVMVAVTVSDNGFGNTNSPFTYYDLNQGDQAWSIFTSPGTYQATFTLATANPTASGALAAIGPPPQAVTSGNQQKSGRSMLRKRLHYADL